MPNSRRETVLAELPSCVEHQRVQVVHLVDFAGETQIELRQQSYGPGVGWFTQSSVALSPEQLGDVRRLLGTLPPRSVRSNRPESVSGGSLRVWQADSA